MSGLNKDMQKLLDMVLAQKDSCQKELVNINNHPEDYKGSGKDWDMCVRIDAYRNVIRLIESFNSDKQTT